jgi:hypothetical protein
MIKRYFDFVNESVELILESDVVYSKMFRTALTKIDNPISKILLDVENKDLPVSSNYFDIAKGKNDHLSVIPDRKAKEILGDTKEMVRFTGSGGGWLKHSEANESIFSKLGYVPEGEAYQPNSSEVGEIVSKITSETSGKVWCYVKFPSGKGVYNQEKLRVVDERLKEVWIKNRQEVRIGRAIRALLTVAGENILDKDLEVFVNQWKATIDKMNDRFQYFDVVDGEDIGHWYHYSNYKERSGSLGSSCMSNVNTNYFDIYIKNVDVCKLIILRSVEDDTKIVGRALLWTLSDGKKFVDRIYTIQDSDVQLFRDYTKENGWYTKQYNSSSDSGRAIAPDGTLVDLGTITVDIISGMYEAYPYLDTLKYFKPREGTLSNVRTGRGDEYTLEDTSGELWRCEYCGGSGQQTCGNCDGDGNWECGRCDGSGEVSCGECKGSGHVEDSEGNRTDCDSCGGDGTNQCRHCDGDGRIECDDCGGRGEHSCYECQ